MITMDKTYKTADGQPMRILCTDANGVYPVISLCKSGVALMHRADGTQAFDERFNLIEVSPYDDFKIDEKVMVRDFGSDRWKRCNFAAVGPDQKPRAWDFGATKWTAVGATVWDECRRPTAEELAA